MKINLNAIVDPYDARVIVTSHHDGSAAEAHFDLIGLPRVDRLLIGKTPEQALYMTEHLCGICPAAHHLAGVHALDQLLADPAASVVSRRAELVRRLLHYGTHIEQHSLKAAPLDRDVAIELRRYGKAAMAAAGCSGHFPDTAVPGGVRYNPSAETLVELRAGADQALTAALRGCELAESKEDIAQNAQMHGVHTIAMQEQGSPVQESALLDFSGANVALCDAEGKPDLLGSHVKAVTADGQVLLQALAQDWQKIVAEHEPGAMAPKPYLVSLGAERGQYRVGPAAQLSIGKLATAEAAQQQQQWLAGQKRALHARMVIAVHCVEMITQVCCELLEISVEDAVSPSPSPSPSPSDSAMPTLRVGQATGLIDSPRGILEHTYAIGDDGLVREARILTPTAQNEPWLAELLTAALRSSQGDERERALEESIREADPCLPISSAPAGTMGVQVISESDTKSL